MRPCRNATARACRPAPERLPSGGAFSSTEAAGSAAIACAARARTAGAHDRLRLHRQETFALHLLARELAGPADRFRLLPRLLFRGFFVVSAKLHLAENALALHLLLERLEGLIDVVITDENLHLCSFVVA